MESEMIVTLRPDGKKGVPMMKDHFDELSLYVLTVLDTLEPYTLNKLLEKALNDFTESLDSDISWYVLQVKLDLEARGLIKVFAPSYNKRLFLLKPTRQGLRHLKNHRMAAAVPGA